MKHICPVCGYDELTEPAYNANLGSLEICASCGFQFGKTDDDEGITHNEWRNKWIKKRFPWDGIDIRPPKDWDPKAQLLNIGIKL